jgi:hypothetical protein
MRRFNTGDDYSGTAKGLNTGDSGRVGAALVDGYLLWHVVQTDGAFEKGAGCGMIALGAQQEVNRVAVLSTAR